MVCNLLLLCMLMLYIFLTCYGWWALMIFLKFQNATGFHRFARGRLRQISGFSGGGLRNFQDPGGMSILGGSTNSWDPGGVAYVGQCILQGGGVQTP